MAHRTHSPAETASPEQRYRVTNWPDCIRALVSRGEVTLWIDDAVLSGWRAIGSTGLMVFWRGRVETKASWQGQAPGLGATLHLAVDTTTGGIPAHELTPSQRRDCPELAGLLAKVKGPVQAVCADAA